MAEEATELDLALATAPVAEYLLPDTSSVGADGSLVIGGVSIRDIANDYGTPTFVYDQQHIEARCREALAAFPDGAAYASKAFMCREMIRVVLATGMKIDVASGGEMYVALRADASPQDLVFHGNNKSNEELFDAICIGVGTIVVDSFDEIERIETLYETSSRKNPISCLLRVTPGITGNTHEHVMTGQNDSKFGFNLLNGSAQRAIDHMRKSRHIDLRGLHVHLGSQIFETEPFVAAAEVLAEVVHKNQLRELCIGGGLGVPYVNGQMSISITEWGNAIQKALQEAGLENDVLVTSEPGRSIVANAAITLYTVGTIKELPDIRTYVSVDGGMSDNPRPALYGARYEAFLPRDPSARRTKEVRIAGKHCESGDVLIKSAFVPEDIQIGDVLATPATGAYGYAMASNYNRLRKPAVLFVKDGETKLAARRETLEDLLRLEP